MGVCVCVCLGGSLSNLVTLIFFLRFARNYLLYKPKTYVEIVELELSICRNPLQSTLLLISLMVQTHLCRANPIKESRVCFILSDRVFDFERTEFLNACKSG